jgi:alanine dehydrogenase
MILEHGYGERFGYSDAQLAPLVGRMASRDQLVAQADVVLLPKPQPQDLAELRDGQTLWGWPHCVQDRAITQLAIDKKLTLIAFEAMNHWASDGGFGLHVFHKNNEMAGYSSVIHALALTGCHGTERARHPRCPGPYQPWGRRRRVPHPLGTDHAVRP